MADSNSQVQFQSLLSLASSAINLLNTISNILFILKSHFQNNMFLASHLTKQHMQYCPGQGGIKHLYGKIVPLKPARRNEKRAASNI